MGDRANVHVHEAERPGVYLYTHWSGSRLPEIVAAALDRGRHLWDDDQYLTRVIFDQMADGDRSDSGFGISGVLGDGDYRIVDVDLGNGTVTHMESGEVRGAWSFAEYVGLRPGWTN